jgi:hypothetical protein
MWAALIAGIAAIGSAAIPVIAEATKKPDPPPAPSPGYVAQAPATRVPDQATVKTEAQAGIYDELKAKQDLKTLKEEEELAAAPAA